MDKHIKLDGAGLELVGGQITARIEADTKKNEFVKGTIKVMPPKAIKNGKIIKDELYDLDYKADIDEKKLTRAGDVVVKLSSPYDAAYVTEAEEGILVTSFCIIVRNRGDKFLSKYLAAFFNSKVYLDQVMASVSGATIPMLTMKKIKDVEVKHLPLNDQEQVARYFENLMEKEELMLKIISLEKEKIDAVLGGN